MRNPYIDIYLHEIITFFEKNPSDLFKLIGNLDKNLFYTKIKEKVNENYEKTGDVPLTQKQMIDIVVEIHNKEKKLDVDSVNIFLKGELCSLCLN